MKLVLSRCHAAAAIDDRPIGPPGASRSFARTFTITQEHLPSTVPTGGLCACLNTKMMPRSQFAFGISGGGTLPRAFRALFHFFQVFTGIWDIWDLFDAYSMYIKHIYTFKLYRSIHIERYTVISLIFEPLSPPALFSVSVIFMLLMHLKKTHILCLNFVSCPYRKA